MLWGAETCFFFSYEGREVRGEKYLSSRENGTSLQEGPRGTHHCAQYDSSAMLENDQAVDSTFLTS